MKGLVNTKVTYGATAHNAHYEHWFIPDQNEGEELQAYLGRLFRFARQCYGLTQAQIAKMIGTKQSRVSRFESGKVGGIKTVSRWFRGFGINIRWETMRFKD